MIVESPYLSKITRLDCLGYMYLQLFLIYDLITLANNLSRKKKNQANILKQKKIAINVS